MIPRSEKDPRKVDLFLLKICQKIKIVIYTLEMELLVDVTIADDFMNIDNEVICTQKYD